MNEKLDESYKGLQRVYQHICIAYEGFFYSAGILAQAIGRDKDSLTALFDVSNPIMEGMKNLKDALQEYIKIYDQIESAGQ